jgi:hypothetical protein
MTAAETIVFDGQLTPGLDIPELWRIGAPYSELSPRRDMRRAGDLLIREHPRENFPEIKTQEELADMLDTAKRHHQMLRSFGMSIVSHETVINPKPWPEDELDWSEEDVVAFSASAYITHLRPLMRPGNKPLRAIPQARVKGLVLEPLHRYLDWAVASKEPLLLDDIFTANQYCWQQSTEIIAMHDIGPQMSPTSSVIEAALEDMEDDFPFVGHP